MDSDGAGDAAITVRGLRKAYGGQPAVAGLDLRVRRGEVFALLGPNGAGKTTTVEILEGHRSRDAGDVLVLGQDPGRPDPAWRSRVGVVLQGTGEFEELRVGELVSHFARFYPEPDDPEAVIDRVGLADKRRALTHTLSGGQRRRLDVALGIIGRPELLFLDEPTTGFDPEARRDFWQLIRQLAAGGTTILLTTHYLNEAEELADRVGVIARGTMLAVATPEELGGRASREATVTWLGPDGARSVRTATPTQLVTRLSTEVGGELAGLTVTRPTLEDVYLAMIGSTREEQ